MFGRMLAGKPKDEKSPVPGRIIKYEIMVHYDKHWVIDCIMDDEEQAIMHARALLTDEKNDEVKVIRQRSMAATGFTTEKPVFEQVRPPKKKEIGLSATINAAPPCEKLEDLFSLDARVLMNRLFREFLDSLVITPTELLHNYGYFKKLDNIGSLISSAVYQVAQAQANAGLGTAKDRANVVHGLIAQATTLARDALVERKRLPPFEPESLAEFCRRVQARVEPHEWRYMVMMTLANHLAGSRNWGQKLEQIVALMGPDIDSDVLSMLDGIVADILGAGAMVQDILGSQPNLGSALGLLALLSTGRLDADPKGASESLKLVRKLIVENEMPACRAVLFDRLKRELNTTKPLNRNDPDSERAALTKLEMLLKTNDGKFIGDDEVKVAFARRQEELRKMLLRKMGVGI